MAGRRPLQVLHWVKTRYARLVDWLLAYVPRKALACGKLHVCLGTKVV